MNDDHAFPWARAAVVVPFVALLVVALVFACKPPSSSDGGGGGDTRSEAPGGTVIPTLDANRSPTPAQVVVPTTAPLPDPSEPPASLEPPMDGYEEPPPPEPPPAAPPVAAEVDFLDPSAVSHAAVVTLWSVDTTKDSAPIDADKRAAPYLDQSLNAEVQMASTTGKLPPDWYELASHQGKTVVVAVPADEAGKPVNTPTEARQAWAVTVSPVGADGWHGVPEQFTVFVTLSRSMVDQPWRVTDYQSA
ncbi:hypothetical protein LO772_22460 [Yinghuangia sp. ASG 101]|uniref:hypothetical protein n=1 Tax=Yinghuangia sp. ASG 101 TaxID=2896848 RepID=UPI001E33C212|nr:hypothetical protein [Yinghuangia sp. ASG 101]UGQ15700.1 hypothetical protein LO772_22460 [Yinghuangia sp. ASG 101]